MSEASHLCLDIISRNFVQYNKPTAIKHYIKKMGMYSHLNCELICAFRLMFLHSHENINHFNSNVLWKLSLNHCSSSYNPAQSVSFYFGHIRKPGGLLFCLCRKIGVTRSFTARALTESPLLEVVVHPWINTNSYSSKGRFCVKLSQTLNYFSQERKT